MSEDLATEGTAEDTHAHHVVYPLASLAHREELGQVEAQD